MKRHALLSVNKEYKTIQFSSNCSYAFAERLYHRGNPAAIEGRSKLQSVLSIKQNLKALKTAYVGGLFSPALRDTGNT